MEGVLESKVCVLEWEVCVLEWEVCVLEWEGGAVGWSGLGVWGMSVNCCLFAGIKKAARRLLFLVSGLSDQNVKNVVLSVDTLSDCASRLSSRTLPSNLALSLLPYSPPVTVNIGYRHVICIHSPVHRLSSFIQGIDVYQWGGSSRRQFIGNTSTTSLRENDTWSPASLIRVTIRLLPCTFDVLVNRT